MINAMEAIKPFFMHPIKVAIGTPFSTSKMVGYV
jgi:hypothetical protein